MCITPRAVWRSILLAGMLILAGCTGGPQAKAVNPYTSLYSGTSELTFATLLPVASAAEGVARGERALAEGKTDLALFEYIRAAELEPDNADIFYKIGAINLQKNAPNKAQSAFKLALARDPQHAGALEGLGLLLLQQRDYAGARDRLERATQNDPQRWKSFNALGILADLRGDFAAARTYYEAALLASPRNALIRNNLGYSRYLAGDWAGAEREYRAALNLAPRYERAWFNLGQLYTRHGRYDQAFDSFSRAMDQAAAYNAVGYICMSEGQYQCAEKFFRQAARTSPSYHVAANENLEQLRRLRGQQQR